MQVSGKVSILLVDDQPARLLTYESILSDLGQNLVTARSGLEALEKLMREEFAVVLLDVSMPEMDGFETARLIHDHPRFERTPIIFVTGVHISELDRLKGYKLGAVDYVSIPVVPEILHSKVAVLVELYCKRRELRELNRNLALANERLAHDNVALREEKTRELEQLNATLQGANEQRASANRRLQSEVVERARAEDALKEADRRKDEFLAMLAHELRNPLAPILTALHVMRLRSADPVDAPELSQEEMNAIVEEAHHWGRKVAAHCHGDAAARMAVQAGVVGDLVEGPGEERRIDRHQRPEALGGEAGRKADRVLLGDADVEEALGELLGELRQAGVIAHRRRHGHNPRILPRQLHRRLAEHAAVAGRRRLRGRSVRRPGCGLCWRTWS